MDTGSIREEENEGGNSLNRDVAKTLAVYGIKAVFNKDCVHFEAERMLGT